MRNCDFCVDERRWSAVKQSPDAIPPETSQQCSVCHKFMCARCERACEQCAAKVCYFCITTKYDSRTNVAVCGQCQG